MPSLMNCWNCNANLGGKELPEDLFFWCDQKCHDEHKEKEKESLNETNEDHFPGTMYYGQKLNYNPQPEILTTPEVEQKGPSGRKVYQCKRCGGIGHNQRTCKK